MIRSNSLYAALAVPLACSPALGVSIQNASTRAETVAGKPGVIRLSVKDGARWRVMLESAPAPRPDRMAAIPHAPKVSVKDNALTLEEYTNGLAKKDNAPQRFKNFDKNGDGKLTPEEFTSP